MLDDGERVVGVCGRGPGDDAVVDGNGYAFSRRRADCDGGHGVEDDGDGLGSRCKAGLDRDAQVEAERLHAEVVLVFGEDAAGEA